MEILDQDMQMVRSWLEETKAPECIKGHFENLVEMQAADAERVEDLEAELKTLRGACVKRDELQEQVDELEAEIETARLGPDRRTRNHSLLASGRACPRSADAEAAAACSAWIVAVALLTAFFWWALGFHIVHKPTDAQLFGCEHTYINDKGEDTGECR